MSTPTIQITFDAADPHALNRFWASVVGYEVEDHHDMVEQLLAGGQLGKDETIELDGRLAFKTAAASCDPEGRRPRLLFQTVPEGKTAKNRVHLDVQVGDDRRDGEVARLLDLGATKLHDGQQGPSTWVTLADPEGNEFCVS